MACIEVFAAGDCLAPTAGGRTGSWGSLTLVTWWRFAVCGMGMAKSCDNLTFYLLEWIYFGINKLENSATTRLCFM